MSHSAAHVREEDASVRHLRARSSAGPAPIGFEDQSGHPVALHGTEDAPFVHIHGVDLRSDARGALTLYSSAALEDQAVIKDSAGRMYASRILLAAAGLADRWLLYFDTETPATPLINGAVPIWRVALPTGALESADELPNGMVFSNSIVVAISTTPLTLTLPGGGEAMFQIGFV